MCKIELSRASKNGYFPSVEECQMRLSESIDVGVKVSNLIINSIENKEIIDIPELFSTEESRRKVYENTIAKMLN